MDIISVIKHEISSVISHFHTTVNIIVSIPINELLPLFNSAL
jgi:hypothetical protein